MSANHVSFYAWLANGCECQMKDEKVTWIPTCLEMDNVWWSPNFCGERTQIGSLKMKTKVTMLKKIHILKLHG